MAGTGQAGYVLVQAYDSDGAEVFSEVTVGAPSGSPPWDVDSRPSESRRRPAGRLHRRGRHGFCPRSCWVNAGYCCNVTCK
jgi:hypothetical protein